jgi:hypothetical protein
VGREQDADLFRDPFSGPEEVGVLDLANKVKDIAALATRKAPILPTIATFIET